MALRTDNNYIRFFVLAVLIIPATTVLAAETISISEVYFNPDGNGLKFIELYNKKDTSQDISGWILEVLDEDMDEIVLPEDATIPGYGFYLIGRSTDESDWSSETYPPDYYAEVTLSYYDDRGAIILMDSSSAPQDILGWGVCSQNYCEGEACGIPSQGYSLERKSGPVHNEMGGNSYDTDNNAEDFRDRSNPEPQNITSIPERPQLNVESLSWGYIRAMYNPE